MTSLVIHSWLVPVPLAAGNPKHKEHSRRVCCLLGLVGMFVGRCIRPKLFWRILVGFVRLCVRSMVFTNIVAFVWWPLVRFVCGLPVFLFWGGSGRRSSYGRSSRRHAHKEHFKNNQPLLHLAVGHGARTLVIPGRLTFLVVVSLQARWSGPLMPYPFCSLRPVAGYEHVAGQGQFEATGDCKAIHRTNHRPRESFLSRVRFLRQVGATSIPSPLQVGHLAGGQPDNRPVGNPQMRAHALHR